MTISLLPGVAKHMKIVCKPTKPNSFGFEQSVYLVEHEFGKNSGGRTAHRNSKGIGIREIRQKVSDTPGYVCVNVRLLQSILQPVMRESKIKFRDIASHHVRMIRRHFH